MSEEKQEPTILEEMQEKQLGYLAGLLATIEENVETIFDKNVLSEDMVILRIQEDFYDYYPELKGYLEKISQKYVDEKQ